ncbi:hypothetical protein GGS21DRAFT_505579 [Xylaria nigripes]|nr:hypothetical protein GGS21DRAFT_505579 [Xylaria nigripes]
MGSIGEDVIQALVTARDFPEVMESQPIRDMLESALAGIWSRVLANENGYIMSRDEFAIFNFFQDRFRNNTVAMNARKRYWDSLSVPITEMGRTETEDGTETETETETTPIMMATATAKT